MSAAKYASGHRTVEFCFVVLIAVSKAEFSICESRRVCYFVPGSGVAYRNFFSVSGRASGGHLIPGSEEFALFVVAQV